MVVGCRYRALNRENNPDNYQAMLALLVSDTTLPEWPFTPGKPPWEGALIMDRMDTTGTNPYYLSADATASPDLELYSSKPQPPFMESRQPNWIHTLCIYTNTTMAMIGTEIPGTA